MDRGIGDQGMRRQAALMQQGGVKERLENAPGAARALDQVYILAVFDPAVAEDIAT